MLLEYFGETSNTTCHNCDVCITTRNNNKDLRQQIIDILKDTPMTIMQLAEHIDNVDDDAIATTVRNMLEYEILDMDSSMQLSVR